ncbi:MAG: carbamoyltransferase HypF [Leptolyngbyaceae cyanobacterium MO_188.B28]|nr:carbamoyltransferase HypF [Leptolyngbyaceae cyanobacterium MO_188.B28]
MLRREREYFEVIRVRGRVQGVGFRPTVYRLAQTCGLTGEVCNDGEGVLILASGTVDALNEFVQRLRQDSPPLARIESISRHPYLGDRSFTDFVITPSLSSAIQTEIAPDAATCARCQAETFNPSSRWYRYPFTNCTHCGPRLSIVRSLPYDRSNTSMASFELCPDCARDYEDIRDRRFHAQPIACWVCGPKVWLERADGAPIESSIAGIDPVDIGCTLLQQGKIVAVKGVGGFHLACDATNEAAVSKLRERKHRSHKPFALMARNLLVIQQYCVVTQTERDLLTSPPAPIVLLLARPFPLPPSPFPPIAASVAPNQNQLGFMLPYTPLHHLLLQRLDRPIVLTSGNLSDEPQCIDNQTARDKLGRLADYLILHNRDIVNRVDDSVVRAVGEQAQLLRRARGYAPAPICLPIGFEAAPDILAMGGELKNTFCLLRQGKAILSKHLGDLEQAASYNAYQESLNLYLQLFEHKPAAIAIDQHPDYLSSKLGNDLAAANRLSLQPIQHHHAHIAACMVENGVPLDASPILGIALDGLGYGEGGSLWGGEFLLADYRHYNRLGTFKPVAMIGGEQAIYQPWRNTYAHLTAAFNWPELLRRYGGLEVFTFLQKQPHVLLKQLVEKGLHAPLASSCGRLFDAVSAALGICRDACSYEGQAAIEMEAGVDLDYFHHLPEAQAYPFNICNLGDSKLSGPSLLYPSLLYIEPRPMWQALLEDLRQDTPPPQMAAKFHAGLANAIVAMVNHLPGQAFNHRAALTGGVFQNRLLLERVTAKLEAQGLTVFTHHSVPANDGGLSLGQAAIAAARLTAT